MSHFTDGFRAGFRDGYGYARDSLIRDFRFRLERLEGSYPPVELLDAAVVKELESRVERSQPASTD